MILQKNKAKLLSLSALFTAIIAASSIITIPTPVPFTLQTLGVFAATLLLGSKYALLSVGAYIALGAIGLPIFSGFGGGVGVLLSQTGGFIIGFLLIPLTNGALSFLFSKKHQVVYNIIGLLLCYLLGAVWFSVYSGEKSFWTVLCISVLPFILPDLLKLFLAVKIVKRLKKVVFVPNENAFDLGLIKRNVKQDIKVFLFDEIDSTNTFAANDIKNNIELPALYLANKQTKGKGTRGRSFYSAGGGLYMSLALKVEKQNLETLTTVAAVATAKAIEELTGLSVGIKWVNDIYISGKKVCGILTENIVDANNEQKGTVIGIGVNLSVKKFPEEIKDIAANVNCKNLSKSLLAAKITNNIFEIISSGDDFLDYYKEKSIVLGKEISYVKNNQTYKALAIDIDSLGRLVVENENQEQETISSGDVTLLK